MPPRQPDYRQQREHGQFVVNLELDAPSLRDILISAWDAGTTLTDWPKKQVDELVQSKFANDDWIFSR